MKNYYFVLLIMILFSACVTKKTANEMVSKAVAPLESKLNQIGDVTIKEKTTPQDEGKALSYKEDTSWKELNGFKYKNYLTLGLGVIWLKVQEENEIKFIEGSEVAVENFGGEKMIVDDGSLIFSYFVNNNFNSDIKAVTAVTAAMSGEEFAKMRYEIMGTSRLAIPIDSLEKIAEKYHDRYNNDNVLGAFLATGFHVKKINLQTYSKIDGTGSVNVPVASVEGGYYKEEGSELNNWFVEARLLDLALFVPSQNLVQKGILKEEQTPYQYIKSLYGDNIEVEKFIEISNDPSILLEGMGNKSNVNNISIEQREKIAEIVKELKKENQEN